MSCAAISANRALGVLAVVWMVIAMRGMKPDAQAGTDGRSTLAPHARRAVLLRAHPEQRPGPCEFGASPGESPPLSIANLQPNSLQPNRKRARVTNDL